MAAVMDQDNEEFARERDGSRTPIQSRSPEPRESRDRDSEMPSSPEKRDNENVQRRRSPPRPKHAPSNPDPTNVVGVFGLSVRTTERDLEEEFGRIADVDKVTVVYDARSQRSRGFGFVTMKDLDGAAAVIKALNGIDLHGRRIRVDYSVTHRAHDPTPGEYRGEPRRDEPPRGGGGGGGGRYPPPPPRGWGPPPGYGYGPPPPRGGYYPPPPPPGAGWGRGPPGGGYGGRYDRDRRDDRGGREDRGGRDDRDYRRGGGPEEDNWRRRERSRSPVRRRERSYSRSPPLRRGRGDDDAPRRRDD